jgi:hypothetical protein
MFYSKWSIRFFIFRYLLTTLDRTAHRWLTDIWYLRRIRPTHILHSVILRQLYPSEHSSRTRDTDPALLNPSQPGAQRIEVDISNKLGTQLKKCGLTI